MALYIGNKKVIPIKVTGGQEINNQDKTITQNGTYTADEGYTGLGTVNVNVSSGGGSSEWQPDPNWWDIKTILQNDTRDYAGKAIILYPDNVDFTVINITSPCVAIGTSDGGFYTSRATHYWDRTQDKESSIKGVKTRYLILYFNTDNVAYTAFNNFKTLGYYAVFKCNLIKDSTAQVANSLFNANSWLQTFDFIEGYNFDFGVSLYNFCLNCTVLKRLPNNLNTSLVTDFSYCLSGCTLLEKLPDDFEVSSGSNFSYFCRDCRSLKELPNSLNFRLATTVANFCPTCLSFIKLDNILDISSATTVASTFLAGCQNLINVKIIIPNISTVTLSQLNNISVESLRFIADNAPNTSSGRLTLGSVNIAKVGGSTSEIIQTLVSKGWTVN